ncbi:hypothetical protein ANN_18240 [Periplaneta americana]|uniref:Mos1 transposase HTH domain-containing protein n=1 Tax=Periplaneta americana TaxID=6978 RepID=A0ABQ8SN76_PERAM|nr:hypothetical protein ANN_18240 [Periplaneta americana]
MTQAADGGTSHVIAPRHLHREEKHSITKQHAVIEFLCCENETVGNIQKTLKKVYGDTAVDRSTVSRYVQYFWIPLARIFVVQENKLKTVPFATWFGPNALRLIFEQTGILSRCGHILASVTSTLRRIFGLISPNAILPTLNIIVIDAASLN